VGIFQIVTYDGASPEGGCTATVLFSSQTANRTWLVTAAHCFSYHDDAYFVHGHFRTPRASVIYDIDSDTVGTLERWSPVGDSQVFVHPTWLARGGLEWFGPPDVAFIRVDMAIPLFDDWGQRIDEFRRPIYTGRAEHVADPFPTGRLENFSQYGFCGQSDGDLRCDELSNLWFSPAFVSNFFQLPLGAWHSAYFAPGDSGGPLLKYAPGFSREWVGSANRYEIARFGVVLGVLQGPTVFCDYIRDGNCNPYDGLAARFYGMDDWIDALQGARREIPRISSWNSAATGYFRSAISSRQDQLAYSGTGTYTFPIYPGKIVGIAIDKSNNHVITWYDSGDLTIGKRDDLDAYSQYPVAMFADYIGTMKFQGVAGKSLRDIVGITMSASGRVYSYYRDGTTAAGTITDLDAYGPPIRYYLPAGRAPADIVGIAARQGGTSGMIAYYRDGTMSEGAWNVLDYYAAPRPYNPGIQRPDEIVGMDTQADNQVVTFFQPWVW